MPLKQVALLHPLVQVFQYMMIWFICCFLLLKSHSTPNSRSVVGTVWEHLALLSFAGKIVQEAPSDSSPVRMVKIGSH